MQIATMLRRLQTFKSSEARAFGDNKITIHQKRLLDAIIFERRLELAAEGHYFFDLVRLGKLKQHSMVPNWIATTNPIWNDGVKILTLLYTLLKIK